MAYFERLESREQFAFALEDRHVHLNATTACVLESGPLLREGGGIDIDRIRAFVESRLYRMPLCRKRLSRVPLEGSPVWIDDESFNLQFHVRHTHLPVPGDERLLKRLCGRLASQRLDPERPLWELWVVEGLEGERCALVAKAHESCARGLWGLGLLEALLSPAPDKDFEPGPPWLPRPAPSGRALLDAALRRRLAFPFHLARGALGRGRDVETLRGELERTRSALGGLAPAPESPLNQPLGPHRRVDWVGLDTAAVRRCAERSSVSQEAVLGAVVAGAVSRFLELRGIPLPFQRELPFRVALPEGGAEQDGEGAPLVYRVAELPIAERDAAARLRAVAHALREAPRASFELFAEAGAWAPRALAGAARRFVGARLANLAVTPFAGPAAPLHFLGARALELLPLLPLLPEQALRVAALPYAGGMRLGFTADWDLVPDLHDLVLASAESFAEIEAAVAAA
jgi:WS/DGAT/MGAT family acyltransferase